MRGKGDPADRWGGLIASHVGIRLVNHYPNTKVGAAPAFCGPGMQPGTLCQG